MSFYGSIYYQLIDTFNKILLNNKGKNKNTFPESIEDTYEENAQGRSGKLSFGTGNKWLSIDKENDGSYRIWHTEPSETDTVDLIAISHLDTLPSGATATELVPDTFIKATTLKCDKAGHISNPSAVYFKMPKSEVEKNIEQLQADIQRLNEKDVEIDNINEEQFTRLSSLEQISADTLDKLGDYSITFPTLSNGQGFFDAFGNIEEIRASVLSAKPDDTSATVSKAIVSLKDITDNLTENQNLLTKSINTSDKNIEQLNSDLTDLKVTVTTTSTNLVSLKSKVGNLETNTGTLETKTENLETETDNLKTQISELQAEIISLKARIEALENPTVE